MTNNIFWNTKSPKYTSNIVYNPHFGCNTLINTWLNSQVQPTIKKNNQSRSRPLRSFNTCLFIRFPAKSSQVQINILLSYKARMPNMVTTMLQSPSILTDMTYKQPAKRRKTPEQVNTTTMLLHIIADGQRDWGRSWIFQLIKHPVLGTHQSFQSIGF